MSPPIDFLAFSHSIPGLAHCYQLPSAKQFGALNNSRLDKTKRPKKEWKDLRTVYAEYTLSRSEREKCVKETVMENEGKGMEQSAMPEDQNAKYYVLWSVAFSGREHIIWSQGCQVDF